MRQRMRRKFRVKPFLLSTSLSAVGITLLAIQTIPARAQGAESGPRFIAGSESSQASFRLAGFEEKQDATQAVGLTIGEIIIKGNKTLSVPAIIIQTGHKIGDPCNDQVLAEMRANLIRTGNFGMHHIDQPDLAVRIQTEEDSAKKQCKVIITVDENEVVLHTEVRGSGPIKPDIIAKLMKLGAVYNEQDVLQGTQAILDRYKKEGFVIQFGDDLGMDPTNSGVLIISIKVARVKDIKLVKLHKTKPYVIFREMRTKKGDYLNRTILDSDRKALYDIGLFDEPPLLSEEITPSGDVNVTLNFVEKRTGVISVGAGYSNRQQLVGRAEITDTNFGGRGETVNLLLESGGVANRSSIELGYTRPWLDKKGTTLQLDIFDKTVYRFSNSLQSNSLTGNGQLAGNQNRYNEQRTGAIASLLRPIRGKSLIAGLTLSAENVKTDPLALGGINTEIIQNGPIYSTGLFLQHSNRDNPFDPVTGGYQKATVSVGFADLKPLKGPYSVPFFQSVLGNVTFGKGAIEYRQYVNLQKKRIIGDEDRTSLAFRFQIGTAVGTLPFFEQYFVGGSESLRGYREDRFWGKYQFLSSLELRQPIAKKILKGVIFLDAGDAWGGRFANTNINGFIQSGFKPHVSIGAGMRIKTPLGPIKLDYGFGDEGGRFHFAIGTQF